MPDSSNEFFYIDENGRKSDARLHDEILNSPEGLATDLAQRIEIAGKLRAEGVAEKVIQELYGPVP